MPKGKLIWDIIPHLYGFMYAVILVMVYGLGDINSDHEFVNASTICVIDMFFEFANIIPTWRH